MPITTSAWYISLRGKVKKQLNNSQAFSRSWRTSAQHESPRFARGAYKANEKPGQAADAFRQAIAADPGNPDPYLDFSQLLMDTNRLKEAAQVATQGLSAVEDKYPVHVRLGSIQMAEGKLAEARQSFQQALGEHPEQPLAHIALAKSYLDEGSNAEPTKILSNARSKLNKNFTLEYFHGLTLLRLERNREAVPVLENAIRLDERSRAPL